MGSVASATSLPRHPPAASLFFSAATNYASRDTASSPAAAAGAGAAAAEGAGSASATYTAATSEKATASAENTAVTGLSPPCGSTAASGHVPAAAAETYRTRRSVFAPMRIWQCGRIHPLLQKRKPIASVSCPCFFRLSCAFPPDVPPPNVSTHGVCGPAAAVVDRSPPAFPAAAASYCVDVLAWKPFSSFAASAAALLRQQPSFCRRCLVFLQLLHAVLWWLATVASVACSGRAAAVLALPLPLPPPCTRRGRIRAETGRVREAGAPTVAAASDAAGLTAEVEEATSGGVAAAANTGAVEVAPGDVITADAGSEIIAGSNTSARGTAAEGEREKSFTSCSALRLRIRAQSSKSDVTCGGRRRSNKAYDAPLGQNSVFPYGRGKRETLTYVLDKRGWTFLSLAAAAALLSGLSVFLLCLWRNDWASIDATIFDVTKRHSHYSHSFLLVTTFFFVYSTLLLLCVYLCLLPRCFLRSPLMFSPSRSHSEGPGLPVHRGSQRISSLDARNCTAAVRNSPCSHTSSCCSNAADSSAGQRKNPPLQSLDSRGCRDACTPFCAAAGSRDTSAGRASLTTPTTHTQVVFVSAPSIDIPFVPLCQELELPLSDSVYSSSPVPPGDPAALAAVEGDFAVAVSTSFSPDVATPLGSTSSMVAETRLRPRCRVSAPMHEASTREPFVASADLLPLVARRLRSSVSVDALGCHATSAVPTTTTTLQAQRRAGNATETTSPYTQPAWVHTAGAASVLYACSLHSPGPAQSPAALEGAAAAQCGAVPALAADAAPSSTYATLRPNAAEEAAAAVPSAETEKPPAVRGGGRDDAAYLPMLVPQRHAVVRVSVLHVVLLLVILVVEVNVYVWTLCWGSELYRYVYFFIHFYAPILYAVLLPTLTLLLAAVLLAPLYSSPPLLQVFTAEAQPLYPCARFPLLHPDAGMSTAAFVCSDSPIPAASVATAPAARCPGSGLPPYHDEGVDFSSRPFSGLRPAASYAQETGSSASPASATAHHADAAAGPFCRGAASASPLPLLPDHSVAVAEGTSSATAAAVTPAANDTALSAEVAVFRAAADNKLLCTAPSVEGRVGVASASATLVFPRSPASLHREGSAQTAADALAGTRELNPAITTTPQTRNFGKQKHIISDKPQRRDQAHLSIGAENSKGRPQQETQQDEQYFFFEGEAQAKAEKRMNLSLRLCCFTALVLLWIMLLIVPFMPFFTSSTCVLRQNRPQKQMKSHPLPFRSRPSRPSAAPVETAGKGGNSREKETVATKEKKATFAQAAQQDRIRGTTAAAAATVQSTKAATVASTVTGQGAIFLAGLDSTGKTRRAVDGVAPAPRRASAPAGHAGAEATLAAAQGAQTETAMSGGEAQAAKAGPPGTCEGVLLSTKKPTATSSTVGVTDEGRGMDGEEEEGRRKNPAASMEGAVGGRQNSVEGTMEEARAGAAGDTVAASEAATVARDAATQAPLTAQAAAAAAKEIAIRVAPLRLLDEAAPARELAASRGYPRKLSILTVESAGTGAATAVSRALPAASPEPAAPLELTKESSTKSRGSVLERLAVEANEEAPSPEKTQPGQKGDIEDHQRPLTKDRQHAAAAPSDAGRGPATVEMVPFEEHAGHDILTLLDTSFDTSRAGAGFSVVPRIAANLEVYTAPAAEEEELAMVEISVGTNENFSLLDARAKARQLPPEFFTPDLRLYPAGEEDLAASRAATAANSGFAAEVSRLPSTGAAAAPARSSPSLFRPSSDVTARQNAAKEGAAPANRAADAAGETSATGHGTAAERGLSGARESSAEEECRASATYASAADNAGQGRDEATPAEQAAHTQCSRQAQGLGCTGDSGATTAMTARRDTVRAARAKGTTAADSEGRLLHQETVRGARRAPRDGGESRRTNTEGGRRGDAAEANAEDACLVEGTDSRGNGSAKVQSGGKDQEAILLLSTTEAHSNQRAANAQETMPLHPRKSVEANTSCATTTGKTSFFRRILPTRVWCAATDLAVWAMDAWEEVQRDPLTLLPPKPLLIGHRGLPAVRPENTEASFVVASEMCDALEADINISRDGVLLVVHDETFRRTTNVASVFPESADDRVHSFDWENIQKLNAGKWWLDADPFGYGTSVGAATQSIIAAEKVPSFEALLRHLVKTKKKLLYDLHCPACGDSVWGCSSRCLRRVKELLRRTNSGKYILWMQGGAEEVKREFSEATIVQKVFWGQFDSDAKDTVEPHAEILNSDWRYSPAASIKKWVEAGYWVNLYVVSSPWILSYAWCAGASSITTDNCISTRKQQAPVYVYTLHAFRFFALLLDAACILLIILCLFLRRWCRNIARISFVVRAVAAEEAVEEDQGSKKMSTCHLEAPHGDSTPFACRGDNASEQQSADSSASSETRTRRCGPAPTRRRSSCYSSL